MLSVLRGVFPIRILLVTGESVLFKIIDVEEDFRQRFLKKPRGSIFPIRFCIIGYNNNKLYLNRVNTPGNATR